MESQELLAAIRTDPDDDGLRLAYADALESSGARDRAEWIRASCDLAKTGYSDPQRDEAAAREADAFERCRPPWWEPITNVTQENDRGMFRFILGEVRSS